MKKLVTVPADVQLQDPVDGKIGSVISFRKFVRETLLTDTQFAANYDSVRSAARIDESFSQASAGGQIALDLLDWERLVKGAKTPSGGKYNFSALAMMQFLPFLDAIIGATDKQE